ncbi:MAG: hypothetical protein K2X87_15790 [Gemmataceae bacterium]|nr:hypothetical protein [Gemmataceae bacterium]
MRLLEQVLFWAHGLSAAAWFGAIFYRAAVIDGKAFGYFPDRREYERFTTHLAHGMRYLVTAGLLTCGLTGFALLGLRWSPGNDAWVGLMAAKVVVWLGACGLFAYVSWVHWPWRSLAAPAEMPGYRREGVVLAAAMVALSGTGFLLGQAGRLAG